MMHVDTVCLRGSTASQQEMHLQGQDRKNEANAKHAESMSKD